MGHSASSTVDPNPQEVSVSSIRRVLRVARDNWLIIVAVLVNVAIAGPLAADWKNDICAVNGHWVQCCTDCTFFCTCGDSPAP
jgi:hypothetical protein